MYDRFGGLVVVELVKGGGQGGLGPVGRLGDLFASRVLNTNIELHPTDNTVCKSLRI